MRSGVCVTNQNKTIISYFFVPVSPLSEYFNVLFPFLFCLTSEFSTQQHKFLFQRNEREVGGFLCFTNSEGRNESPGVGARGRDGAKCVSFGYISLTLEEAGLHGRSSDFELAAFAESGKSIIYGDDSGR